MMQRRLLRVFKPGKPISSSLPQQQIAARSFSSTSGLHQRYHYRPGTHKSKTQHGAQRPITRETLTFSAKKFKAGGQRTIESIAPANSSMLDEDLKRVRRKHGTPPKEGLRGMDGQKRLLYWKPSIRYWNDRFQKAEDTEEDKSALAAAEKFFEQPCELLYSAASNSNHAKNDHIPEIVVVGASNAGKSTFLNALIGGVDIAKVSQRPGKTTTMNAYGVGPRPKIPPELIRKGDAPPKHSLVIMDTPGYGYRSKATWGETIVQYLSSRKMLRGAIILIPAMKDNHGMDTWMLKTLARTNIRTLVVITKADKCGTEWKNRCHSVYRELEEEIQKQNRLAPGNWREGTDRLLSIYATAAGMNTTRRIGNGAGIGGVRLAILELAGYTSQGKVEKQPETKAYTGEIVSFDDIVWKA